MRDHIITINQAGSQIGIDNLFAVVDSCRDELTQTPSWLFEGYKYPITVDGVPVNYEVDDRNPITTSRAWLKIVADEVGYRRDGARSSSLLW